MADSSTSSTVQSGEPAAIVRKGVAIAGIQVSVKKSEAHTYTSQATELAMESGATVTDHVILKPVTLAVTETPLRAWGRPCRFIDDTRCKESCLDSSFYIENISAKVLTFSKICGVVFPRCS